MSAHRCALFILAVITALSLVSCGSRLSPALQNQAEQLPYYSDNTFYNVPPTEPPSIGKIFKITARMATKDRSQSVPGSPLPIEPLTLEALNNLSSDDLHIVKLGHSSLLLKVYGEYWLVDPVFSERVSPFSFAGPKRFHPPPLPLDQLPDIDRVLITHDHYDHLDKLAISSPAFASATFMVPLGVEAHLIKWGIPEQSIASFEWWQEADTNHALIVFTPAQHFSGRTLNDRNHSLWGSWVIKTAKENLFISGDTGYFEGFKTIGEKYGPFDFTFIETGAYSEQWHDIHLFPEQSVQAHLDLQGITLVPVHNGTFDLAFHPWKEPLERVTREAEKRGISLLTPITGQVFSTKPAIESTEWWKLVD